MLAIRKEISEIENGHSDRDNNALKNAPHTMEDLVKEWDRPLFARSRLFSRQELLGLINIGHLSIVLITFWGDRNLTCTCPPMEAYG